MRYQVLDENGLNFVTMTVVDWIDLFTRPVYSDIIVDSLRFSQEKKGMIVCAYVIMPSHLHLILYAEKPERLSKLIREFKSYTAKQILKYIKNKRNIESRRRWLLHHFSFNSKVNKTKGNFQVWQQGSHPIYLYSPLVIRQKLNYIHNNPVKAKMVHVPEGYVFSSASNYITGKGVLNVHLLNNIWTDTGKL
jgi:putative transposase